MCFLLVATLVSVLVLRRNNSVVISIYLFKGYGIVLLTNCRRRNDCVRLVRVQSSHVRKKAEQTIEEY